VTLLDRHIARQFITNTLLLLFILFAFIIAVDVSVKFDEYTRAARLALTSPQGPPGWGRTMVFALGLVLDFWWPQLIQLAVHLLGLVMIAGAGFTLAQMVKYRELVAMLAGGISLRRAAAPILAAAALFSLGQLAVQEYVLPRIAPLLTRTAQQAGHRTLGVERLKLTADAQGRVFHAAAFDADKGILTGLSVIERDPSGVGVREISADRAVWNGKSWTLEQGFVRPFADASALPQRLDRLETNLDPMSLRLRRFAEYRHTLSYAQAGEMLRAADRTTAAESARGSPLVLSRAQADEIRRIQLGRFGTVLCNLLGLVIALPVFLRREPVPMMLPSIKAAPIAMIVLLGGFLGTSLPVPALPAALSVFLPALVMLPLAIASATSLKT
jgi:lipopolysaccharide export system permease protein